MGAADAEEPGGKLSREGPANRAGPETLWAEPLGSAAAAQSGKGPANRTEPESLSGESLRNATAPQSGEGPANRAGPESLPGESLGRAAAPKRCRELEGAAEGGALPGSCRGGEGNLGYVYKIIDLGHADILDPSLPQDQLWRPRDDKGWGAHPSHVAQPPSVAKRANSLIINQQIMLL